MIASWQESYDKPNMLKSKDITWPTKVRIVKAMVFPVVTYSCESWMVKKRECRPIDVFKLWCWRRLLRVSWIARRSNQSILKKSTPTLNIHWKDWCWSSNTLATCSEELTHRKTFWHQERSRARGEGMTKDETVGWHYQLNGYEFEQASGDGEEQGRLARCSLWGHRELNTP